MNNLLENHPDIIKSESLDLLLADDTKQLQKMEITPDRIKAQLGEITKAASFWREYPDKFIDFMKGPNSKFNLFFYQRVFLRSVMRNRYAYATFPRAYSKSFLSIMALLTRCILYPGAKLFITSGGKEQAANIAREKIDEILDLIPGFKREIDWKQTNLGGKDYVRVVFKNGSKLDIVAASQRTRGGRRHGGLIEEAILVDGVLLNEVILPLMNVSRRCANGQTNPDETLNKSQIYVTTAGWKGTFAYDKLIQMLIWQILKPGTAVVLGGTWRVPVLMELLDKNFVKDLKADGTFNETSFAREYESIWSGSAEDAFFNSDMFDKHREIKQPEYEYSGRSTKDSYYLLSVDVGRIGCSSVVCVFKVIPQPEGNSIKKLVNMYTFDEEHMGIQALRIKSLFYKYKAKAVVIDGNGLGVGLIDFMVIKSIDEATGDEYPAFDVINDTEGLYKKFKTVDSEKEAIYIIKANAPLNTEIHSNCSAQINAGKVKFLEDERFAKSKLLGTKVGENMTPEQRAEYLRPFTLTSILKEEMMNLREEHDGVNIILKQANRKIKKDKFSAFEYGLYYIKQLDESKKKRKKAKISDFMFYS